MSPRDWGIEPDEVLACGVGVMIGATLVAIGFVLMGAPLEVKPIPPSAAETELRYQIERLTETLDRLENTCGTDF